MKLGKTPIRANFKAIGLCVCNIPGRGGGGVTDFLIILFIFLRIVVMVCYMTLPFIHDVSSFAAATKKPRCFYGFYPHVVSQLFDPGKRKNKEPEPVFVHFSKEPMQESLPSLAESIPWLLKCLQT
jgi:hypothetical protein